MSLDVALEVGVTVLRMLLFHAVFTIFSDSDEQPIGRRPCKAQPAGRHLAAATVQISRLGRELRWQEAIACLEDRINRCFTNFKGDANEST